MKNTFFPTLYKSLLSKHPTIVKVDNHTIREIEKTNAHQESLQNTGMFIGAMIFVLLLFVYLPSTLNSLFSVAETWESQFSTMLNIRSVVENRPDISFSISVILICIIVLPIMLSERLRKLTFWPANILFNLLSRRKRKKLLE
jgi:hypothetical protein